VKNRTERKSSYDRVADEYVRRMLDELRDKPFDREVLDRFADAVRGQGAVCDIGCGPGHVTRYLRDRGVEISGIDISEAMIERARRLNAGIEFQQGDMTSLPVPDGTWVGIVAFYSIIHVSRDEVVATLRELHRTLRPTGLLLLAFHVGTETMHLDEWLGQKVSVDFVLFTPQEMTLYLRAAGFEIADIKEREPYPDIEHQRRRAYILARRGRAAQQADAADDRALHTHSPARS